MINSCIYLSATLKDKAVSTFIRRRLQVGAIDLSGEVAERKIGAPQGGVISPLLCKHIST